MKTKILVFLPLALVVNQAQAVEWVGKWFDAPAQSQIQADINKTRVTPSTARYIRSPGGTWNLNTAPATSTGGAYISGGVSGANPAAISKVSIPYGSAAGAAVFATATMAAPILKTSLAKAATFLVRANPYVATALTMGWLANAGYQYYKATDTFTQSPPAQPNTYYCLNYGGWASSCQQTQAAACSLFKVEHPTYTTCTPLGNNQYQILNQYGGGETNNFITGTGCISPYVLQNGVCTSSATPTPATPAQVEAGLGSAQMSPAGDTEPVKAGIVDELIKNGVMPDHETEVLTGPASVQGEHSTTTTPDGNVTTSNTVYNNTYTANYVDVTKTTTTTTTIPPSTTTKTGPADVVPTESKTDCDKYPDSIGCAKFGTIPTADILPTTNVSLNLNVGGYSAGECPAPQTLALSRGTFSLSNQPLCDLATGTKPLFIALAYLAAGYIVLGSVRGV